MPTLPTKAKPVPLRILIFGLNYTPELTGIGKYTGDMATWLALQGHQVRVVTAPPYYPAWRVSDAYRGKGYVVEGGGPAGDGAGEPLVYRCPLYVPAQASGLRRILHLLSFAVNGSLRMLREAFARPDLVLTVEPTFFCAPIALAAGALARAATWLHVQDLEVDAAFDLGLLPSGGIIQRIALELEGAFTRAFTRVSSISVRMVEQCLAKGVPTQRAILFPNWVDVDLIQPQPAGESTNAFRQELGLGGKVVFLYSGNMGNKQGLELLAPLAHAFRGRGDVHFVFCGDGTYRPTLEKEVAGAPNVTLLPLQPLELLNNLLNAADVHLLPQRANTADLVMPSRLTGMLSSGRPVLACAEPGTQVAAVLSGNSGAHAPCGSVVPVGSLDHLIRGARALAQDETLRQALGSAARTYAVQQLGREQVLRRFEADIYAAVLAFRSPTDKLLFGQEI